MYLWPICKEGHGPRLINRFILLKWPSLITTEMGMTECRAMLVLLFNGSTVYIYFIFIINDYHVIDFITQVIFNIELTLTLKKSGTRKKPENKNNSQPFQSIY